MSRLFRNRHNLHFSNLALEPSVPINIKVKDNRFNLIFHLFLIQPLWKKYRINIEQVLIIRTNKLITIFLLFEKFRLQYDLFKSKQFLL